MSRRLSPVIPGFGLTLGFSLSYLALIVLIPLAGMFIYSFRLSWADWWQLLTSKELLYALRLSLTTALMAALINALLGFILAWVLVRYEFWGRRLIDTMIDLPFALPTAVAGIALTSLYAKNGLLGGLVPFPIAYQPLGIALALVFVTLPFVVRTLQPVFEDIPPEVEEAAASLGARPWQVVRHVIIPALLPAWLTGFALSFARGLGEYGSVVFIAGNIPFKTEILPLLIVSKLDQYNYPAATGIAVIMLVISFFLLLLINLLQRRIQS